MTESDNRQNNPERMEPILDPAELKANDETRSSGAHPESPAGSGSTPSRREPYILLVLAPFLFAECATIYTQVVPKTYCGYDLPASLLFSTVVLIYLTARSLTHSENLVRSTDPGGSSIPAWCYIVIGFTPSLLYFSHEWRACILGTSGGVPFKGFEVSYTFFFVGLISLFMLASFVATRASGGRSGSQNETRSVSKFLLMPAALFSLLISLGSQNYYLYFTDYFGVNLIYYIIYARYAILVFVALLVLIDAFRILSPKLRDTRQMIDAFANRFLRIDPIDYQNESWFDIVSVSLLNSILFVLRYMFQFGSWAGLSIWFFLVSLTISVWRFVYNAGTKFTFVFSVLIITTLWLAERTIFLPDDFRSLILGTDSLNYWVIVYLFFFVLGLCASYRYVTHPQEFNLAAIADGAGFVIGFAAIGVWISSLFLHITATMAWWGADRFFRAPGFAGSGSLGGFICAGFLLLGLMLVGSLASNSVAKWRSRRQEPSEEYSQGAEYEE